MKKEIYCKKCDTIIANDDGECVIPIKTRMRFNYKEMLSTILCQSCNFLNYFRDNEVLEDSEKRNSQYILENSRKFTKQESRRDITLTSDLKNY